jgi:hypothetical protein
MQTVVMLKPLWQLCHRSFGVRQVSKGDIVSLKGFDKALSHSIGLRAFNGRSYGLDVHSSSMLTNPFVRVARTVVGQELDLPGRSKHPSKTLLNGSHQHVLDQDPVNALGCGHPTDRLSVAAILNKRNADLLVIPALNLKPIGAPTGVAPVNRYSAVMSSGVVLRAIALGQQEVVFSHDPVDSFAVHSALPVSMPAITNHAPDTDVAVARLRLNDGLNLSNDLKIGCCISSPTPAIRPARRPGAHCHDVAARHTERLADSLHWPSSGNTGERASHFFDLAKSTASLSLPKAIPIGPSNHQTNF